MWSLKRPGWRDVISMSTETTAAAMTIGHTSRRNSDLRKSRLAAWGQNGHRDEDICAVETNSKCSRFGATSRDEYGSGFTSFQELCAAADYDVLLCRTPGIVFGDTCPVRQPNSYWPTCFHTIEVRLLIY